MKGYLVLLKGPLPQHASLSDPDVIAVFIAAESEEVLEQLKKKSYYQGENVYLGEIPFDCPSGYTTGMLGNFKILKKKWLEYLAVEMGK